MEKDCRKLYVAESSNKLDLRMLGCRVASQSHKLLLWATAFSTVGRHSRHAKLDSNCPASFAGNEGHEGDEGKPDRLFHFFWTMYDQHPTLVADALSSDTVRTRMTRTRTEGVEETAS